MEHPGHRRLDRRDVPAHPLVVVVAVDLPGRPQHQQPELLQLDPGLGDHLLHELLLREQLALRAPRDGPLAASCRAHGGPCPTVRMAWWMRPPPRRVWATTKASPRPPEQVLCGHPDVGVAHVGVGALAWVSEPRGRRCARSRRQACRSGRSNIDWRWYGGLSGSVTAMTMRNSANLALRREPLLAVDHPLVTVEPGRAGELLGVGAALRLGHREAGHRSRRRAAAAGTAALCSSVP